MCRSGSDFAVCPRRFCRARCLAEGFGESKNWKSSMRPDMLRRDPQVCRCRVSKDLDVTFTSRGGERISFPTVLQIELPYVLEGMVFLSIFAFNPQPRLDEP